MKSLRKLYLKSNNIPDVIFKCISFMKNLELFEFKYNIEDGIKCLSPLICCRLENNKTNMIVKALGSSENKDLDLELKHRIELILFEMIAKSN